MTVTGTPMVESVDPSAYDEFLIQRLNGVIFGICVVVYAGVLVGIGLRPRGEVG
jgi:hypothetical protein